MRGKLTSSDIARATVRGLTVSLLAIAAAGCPFLIDVPHPVDAEVVRVDQVEIPSDVYVTVGPRKLIETIAEKIVEHNSAVELIDPIRFRDAAFPDGGWRADQLLNEHTCSRLQQDLNLDFVVLLELTPPVGQVAERGISFGLGRAGYADMRSHVSAIVITLPQASVVCRLDTSAEGRIRYFVTWSGGYSTTPMTEQAAITALATSIASILDQAAPSENIRVSVLAAERLYLK